jgi:glycosyltransferase involved in cell wall biosynthesis
VASNVNGNTELIEDRKNGLLFPVGRAGQLADAVIQLIEKPELRKKMGDNGRKRVLDSFTIHKYIRGIETVFEEILER